MTISFLFSHVKLRQKTGVSKHFPFNHFSRFSFSLRVMPENDVTVVFLLINSTQKTIFHSSLMNPVEVPIEVCIKHTSFFMQKNIQEREKSHSLTPPLCENLGKQSNKRIFSCCEWKSKQIRRKSIKHYKLENN